MCALLSKGDSMRKKLLPKNEKTVKSLKLGKETLANLSSSELQNAKGGSYYSCPYNSYCCAW
jgi:natural product precursor